MSGTKYYVDIEFRTLGDSAAGADRIGKTMADAGKKAKDSGKEFDDINKAIGSVAGTVTGLAMSFGQMAIGSAIGAITYGVLSLNKELETTTVSLAAVLNSKGFDNGGGIEGAMGQASKWVKEMKKDARDLPGEFEDLLGIVQTGAGAAFNMGLDPAKFEKMAANAMAAGKALAVPMDQAGRELAHLMEGRAGAQNVFGTRLGISAHEVYKDIDGAQKKFNELSKEGRAKTLEEKIGAFQPAIKAFANTYDAQSSTMVDNAKQLVQLGTQELFGRVVNDLIDVNTWIDENRDTLEAWAKSFGHDLVDIHDKLRSTAEEWAPILKDMAQGGYTKFVDTWRELAPILSVVAGHMKDISKEGGSFSTVMKWMKEAGGGVGGLLLDKDTRGTVTDLATTTAGSGLFGGTDVAGYASKLPEGAVEDIGLKSLLGGAPMAILDMIEQTKESSTAWQDTMRIEADFMAAQARMAGDQFGFVSMAGAEYQQHLEELTRTVGDTEAAVFSFQVALNNADADLKKDKQDAMMNDINDEMMRRSNAMAQDVLHGKVAQDKRKKETSGKGGMTVNGNVYFTISSNQAPGQIARELQRTLIEKRRFPTSSPHTKNFGVTRSG